MCPSPSSPTHEERPPYEVYPYSFEKLLDIFISRASDGAPFIGEKFHCEYFKEYFGAPDIDAKTIIVENGYIDKNYLEDFQEYYLTCFKHYSKRCTRLHFFSMAISPKEFRSVVEGKSLRLRAELSNSYLGFVVVKPLPETIIGKTCLKVYRDDGGRRRFLGIRSNEVNLFGLRLAVESLPFQEQDHAVAACATSALWSVFQATGHLFQHAIPSPSAITKAATEHAHSDGRSFPSSGLTLSEMASAVRSVGLDPIKISVREANVFTASLHGYLSVGVPIVLGFDLIKKYARGNLEYLGRHAVAVTGYSLSPTVNSLNGGKLRMKADAIDKIYVHDDQVGPFARMKIEPAIQYKKEKRIALSTSWGFSKGKDRFLALPTEILVPLAKKIRIPMSSIYKNTVILAHILSRMGPVAKLYPQGLLWDITLVNNNHYKEHLLAAKHLRGERLRNILTAGLPRYLWKCSVSHGAQPLADFLFDTTDVEQGDYLSKIVQYDDFFETVLRQIASHAELLAHCRLFLNSYATHPLPPGSAGP